MAKIDGKDVLDLVESFLRNLTSSFCGSNRFVTRHRAVWINGKDIWMGLECWVNDLEKRELWHRKRDLCLGPWREMASLTPCGMGTMLSGAQNFLKVWVMPTKDWMNGVPGYSEWIEEQNRMYAEERARMEEPIVRDV